MVIEVNGKEYELSTKLRTIEKIENEFKASVSSIFQVLDEAKTNELIKMLAISSGIEKGNTELTDALRDNWDYGDIVLCVRDLLVQMMFSGGPEQQERKLAKFVGDDEERKNEMREMLGLPKSDISE